MEIQTLKENLKLLCENVTTTCIKLSILRVKLKRMSNSDISAPDGKEVIDSVNELNTYIQIIESYRDNIMSDIERLMQ